MIKIITLLASLALLNSCEVKKKVRCEHEYGKWGEPITTDNAFNGQTSAQFRTCEKCGETSKRRIH